MSRTARTPTNRRVHEAPVSSDNEWVTVNEFCAEMKITRRTFDRWRAKETGPRFDHIGGHGPLRARRSWIDEWLKRRDDEVA